MENIWKERVRADIKRRTDQDRGTGRWFNKGLIFDHSFKLKRNQKEILDIILGLLSSPPETGPLFKL